MVSQALLVAAITVAFIISLVSAIAVVRLKDFVYASVGLGVLGVSTAAIVALMGYGVVAAFIVIVYVGAAVMFIIISMSMLGGAAEESWDHERGAAAAALAGGAAALVTLGGGLYLLYNQPGAVDLRGVAATFLGDAPQGLAAPLFVVIAGLAATILEAIAVARRG